MRMPFRWCDFRTHFLAEDGSSHGGSRASSAARLTIDAAPGLMAIVDQDPKSSAAPMPRSASEGTQLVNTYAPITQQIINQGTISISTGPGDLGVNNAETTSSERVALIKERKRLRRQAKEHPEAVSEDDIQRVEQLNQLIGDLTNKCTRPDERRIVLRDRYEFVSELGRGRHGKVWSCFDTQSERLVAIKILHHHLHDDEEWRDRFVREVCYVTELRERFAPNIVRVYDARTDYPSDPIIYYVMEQVHGGRNILDVAADEGIRCALELFLQTCRAVAAAHAVGICHRDLKPSNILVDTSGEPTVKVCDFGLAKAYNSIHFSSDSDIIGTIGYAAPEQLAGGQRRNEQPQDIFSLGMVLHTVLIARRARPFEYKDREAMARSLIERTAPFTTIPERFAAIVLRAVEEDPSRRHTSVDDLAGDVEALLPYVASGALGGSQARRSSRRRAT